MTTGWVELGVSESPEAAAMDAESAFVRVAGAVLVERDSWEDALKVTQYLRARPSSVPVRLSPMDETADEWTAAVRALPRCIHVFVGSRCFACRAPADGGRFSDGAREWPVCKAHATSYVSDAIERGPVDDATLPGVG